MKKLLIMLLLVSLSVFTVGALAMADDSTTQPAPQAASSDVAQTGSSGIDLYLDYSRVNETNYNGIYSNSITLGVDYSQDFLAGAYYSAGSNYGTTWDGTSVPSGFAENAYMAYFGYNVIRQEGGSLGIIASYWDVTPKWDGSNSNNEISSVGIGAKGALNFGPVNVSLLATYGVSNNFKINGSSSSDKIHTSLVELKGVYYFSDLVGAHIVYRWVPVTCDNFVGTFNFSGVGLGVDFRF